MNIFLILLTLTGAAQAKAANVQTLSSPLWLRDASFALEHLCKYSKRDCQVESSTVEPFNSENPNPELSFEKDFAFSLLETTRFLPLKNSEIKPLVMRMLKVAGVVQDQAHLAAYRNFLRALSQIDPDFELTAREALSFSSLAQHSHLFLFIKSKRYQVCEVLEFQVGRSEFMERTDESPETIAEPAKKAVKRLPKAAPALP